MGGPDRGTRKQRVRGIGRALVEIIEAAGQNPGLMLDRRQPASRVGAEAQPLPARGAMADRTIHLVATKHELHGPADQACGHDAENLRAREQALAAEAAAEEWAADVDI